MNYRKSLFAGILCAVLCAVCVGLYMLQLNGETQAAREEALARFGGDQLEVWVATKDIAAGETIDAASIETRMWIADLLPAEAITETENIVGEPVSSTILAGEVVTSKRLGSSASSYNIPTGFTALSVPARDVQAIGGALRSGMRTDVYATGSSSTTLIASQLLVLETSVRDEEIASGSLSWITLAVPPERVQEMIAAAQNLELYFAVSESSASSTSHSHQDSSEGASSDIDAPSEYEEEIWDV